MPDYKLLTQDNQPTALYELFGTNDELIVYHFMHAEEACFLCSFFVDQLQGAVSHLQPRVSLAVVTEADPDKIKHLVARKNWHNINFVSSIGSGFGEEFGVVFRQEAVRDQTTVYNYNRSWRMGTQAPGISVFKRDRDARKIFHTYSTYSAGLSSGVGCVFSLLDLTPSGM